MSFPWLLGGWGPSASIAPKVRGLRSLLGAVALPDLACLPLATSAPSRWGVDRMISRCGGGGRFGLGRVDWANVCRPSPPSRRVLLSPDRALNEEVRFKANLSWLGEEGLGRTPLEQVSQFGWGLGAGCPSFHMACLEAAGTAEVYRARQLAPPQSLNKVGGAALAAP